MSRLTSAAALCCLALASCHPCGPYGYLVDAMGLPQFEHLSRRCSLLDQHTERRLSEVLEMFLVHARIDEVAE
jgi:hypothetical protein